MYLPKISFREVIFNSLILKRIKIDKCQASLVHKLKAVMVLFGTKIFNHNKVLIFNQK